MYPTGNSGVYLNQNNGHVNTRLLPTTQRPIQHSTFNGVIANNAAIQRNGGLLCIPENNQLLTSARTGIYNNTTHTVTESYQNSDYPIGYQNGACISHPYRNGSIGYDSVYGGGGQAMYPPPQYNATIVPGTQTSTPSLFDMIAKSQYNNSKTRRASCGARRASCGGKRGSAGFSGILSKSLSKNKVGSQAKEQLVITVC